MPHSDSNSLRRIFAARGAKLTNAAVAAIALTLAASAFADPKPGDVFREYRWRPLKSWDRFFAPDATAKGAIDLEKSLPKPLYTIDIADLEGATRIEAQIELLQSHAGTIGQSFRLNEGEWIPIPPSKHIPGKIGLAPDNLPSPPQRWLTMRYPTVEVPLSMVKKGKNTFEFRCQVGPVNIGKTWPQSVVYGGAFRVYYKGDKGAPTGRVSKGTPGANNLTRNFVVLEAELKAAAGRAIRRVDFLTRYEGFEWAGDGEAMAFHHNTLQGEIRNHAGTAYAAPWKITWDARWVPNQKEPVQVMARIEDDTGLYKMTEPLELKYNGNPRVQMFRAYDIPPGWLGRNNKHHTCKVKLPDDLARLREAKIVFGNWNGDQAHQIGVNDMVLVGNIGRNHDLSYDELTVPVSVLKPGENVFFTKGITEHHGIEVLWPAFTVLARFAAEGEEH